MQAVVRSTIDSFDREQWNALDGCGVPFLAHEFLGALERARCVGPESGWMPSYVALVDERGLAAATPAFTKAHSYGEFVFDFAWAQAYARAGRQYYPKLVLATPFTPATGPRLLLRQDARSPAMRARLIEAIADRARAAGCSSVHALFISDGDRAAFADAGWLLRRDCQFHWRNRNYASFDEYLAGFTAEKRKKARRERRRIVELGITFDTWLGGKLDDARLDRVFALHRDTFLRHGHEPYLTREFFGVIAREMGDAIMVKAAILRGQTIAAAIFFRSHDALYGRYWGASADYHSLHFEACYHQGIEYCIAEGLQRFEPGTQGEHKVSRGFEPQLTWSAHYIADARFRAAIGDYLEREADAVDSYAAEVQRHVPYR